MKAIWPVEPEEDGSVGLPHHGFRPLRRLAESQDVVPRNGRAHDDDAMPSPRNKSSLIHSHDLLMAGLRHWQDYARHELAVARRTGDRQRRVSHALLHGRNEYSSRQDDFCCSLWKLPVISGADQIAFCFGWPDVFAPLPDRYVVNAARRCIKAGAPRMRVFGDAVRQRLTAERAGRASAGNRNFQLYLDVPRASKRSLS